jgi:hypothetical protein
VKLEIAEVADAARSDLSPPFLPHPVAGPFLLRTCRIAPICTASSSFAGDLPGCVG